MIPIIIPFYKAHDKLKKCLAAISAQTLPGCEPFVRDNTHDNILYTAAVNEGLRKYAFREDVRYVVVLNQDAYMQPDCVRRLVEFMDAHPDCGIACPVQYADTRSGGVQWDTSRKTLSVADSRVVSWAGSLQAFPFGVHRTEDMGSLRAKAPFETYWANGACMMIRTETIRECGLFDRNMRFICSDSDFSFTVRARGWKVFVVPQATCEHSLGASGAPSDAAIELAKVRDVLYFTEKWLAGGVYRRLAYEGPGLTAGQARQVLRRCAHEARVLERRLGERAPSATDSFPSWVAHMQAPAPQRSR